MWAEKESQKINAGKSKMKFFGSILLAVVCRNAVVASTIVRNGRDLHSFTVKGSEETFLAYKPRSVESFYQGQSTRRRALKEDDGDDDKEEEREIQVCNLTRDLQDLKWEDDDEEIVLISIPAFTCAPILVEDGEVLCFHNQKNFNKMKCQKEVTVNFKAIELDGGKIIFDPYKHYSELSDITGQREYHGVYELTPDEVVVYVNGLHNIGYGVEYRRLTGRGYSATENHGTRDAVDVHMWDADYFGQGHVVNTSDGKEFTLTAASCSPRVFEIDDFLSNDEIAHLLELAAPSDILNTGDGSEIIDVHRYESSELEAIYKRAGEVLKLSDESFSLKGEDGTSDGSVLKVHRCGANSEQRAPTPKGMPLVLGTDHHQFVSLVLFLNDNYEEGEMEFPRWENLEGIDEALKISPKKGKAVLVYQMLPDGNIDEYARYSFAPVAGGTRLVSTMTISDDIVAKKLKHEF